jgi:hypothetical protein
MLNTIISGRKKSPRRVCLYGTHGIGKSYWAAAAPSPIFLNVEDGLDGIECQRTPLIKDFATVSGWLSCLLTEPHDRRTLVIDTGDWLERIIHADVAASLGKNSIEDIGYGKGYVFALNRWDFLLRSLDHLRTQRGMSVIMLCHARITKFSPPDADTYDRYEPDLHKSVCPMIQEWADEVLFAAYRVNTIKREERFNQERTRAVGTGERVIYTCESPTHLAKRRANLPDVLPLNFNAYAAALAANYNGNGEAASNIAGVVTNGHSKTKEV